MTALDLSANALRLARKNLKIHKLEKKVRLIKSDLFAGFSRRSRPVWDIIVTNPPYIPTCDLKDLPAEVRREPRNALDGGTGGTQIIEKILDRAWDYLSERGWLVMEISEGQRSFIENKIARAVHERLPQRRSWHLVEWIRDLNGIDRVAVIRKS